MKRQIGIHLSQSRKFPNNTWIWNVPVWALSNITWIDGCWGVSPKGWMMLTPKLPAARQKLALAKAAGEPEEAHHKHQRFLLRGPLVTLVLSRNWPWRVVQNLLTDSFQRLMKSWLAGEFSYSYTHTYYTHTHHIDVVPTFPTTLLQNEPQITKKISSAAHSEGIKNLH